ncbi:hypothetical protein Y1Q_0000391 [Alligator mississippiensis]|uniref:Uncharacterized protein n=1 Tax=Alligator mississippiensis TaxID=8496 RepID=A0A151MAX2_ALLMI|nr:hypothetical protein Y1Q_0000391 [Alligator mississippiensis]
MDGGRKRHVLSEDGWGEPAAWFHPGVPAEAFGFGVRTASADCETPGPTWDSPRQLEPSKCKTDISVGHVWSTTSVELKHLKSALDTLKRQLNDALHYTEVNQEK